tara:strand:- start:830 stop:1051 length:222 start_codon:yes stop_codon:yes gene_type:complete
MIGPQAYENLFQATHITKTWHALFLNYEGKEYMYMYDWEDLGFFDGFAGFLHHAIEDVQDRDGEYTDSMEVIA